tara:strand:- start:340 stop:549 length:210 start_codon:yes stop_codon:yes gene_type:complete
MIHITNNFVWLDVTKRCENTSETKSLAGAHELYEVLDDKSDHLIEDVDAVPTLIANGAKICIEVGYLIG